MELLSEISDSIDSLVQLNRDRLSQHLKNITDSSCIIDEDSDLFGFSLVHDDIDDSRRSGNSQTHAKDVIQRFRSDDNWFNSKAVDLMCNSYGIDSTNQYDSLLLLSRGVDRRTNNNNSTTYLTIKREQNHMFARNLFMEGANLIRAMKYDDAVKKLSDAIHFNDQFIDAYMERAQAYELLSLQQEALNDYNKVKELRTATVADDDIILPTRSKLSNNSDLITKLQYSIYQDSSSKGSTQRRTQSVLTAAVRGAHTSATDIQHIRSPDSSSTADNSSISEDQLRGSSKHDAVDDDGDKDDESMDHRKKKKRKRKKEKKKKHKKVKKNKMRKQSD